MDRFGQIAPRVLIGGAGYVYAGKRIDLRSRLADVVAHLPTVELVVVVSYLEPEPDLGAIPRARSWREFVAGHDGATPTYVRLPFDHPALILY